MKKFLITAILANSFCLLIAQTTFQRTYSSNSYDSGSSIAKSNEGYVVAGRIEVGGNPDVYLIGMNGVGDTLWTKKYGGAGVDIPYEIRRVSDGGYIIVGTTGSFGSIFQIYLLKTDSLGNAEWAKHIGGGGYDEGFSVRETADGGFVVLGYSDYGSGAGDFYFVKTDALGTVLWTKTYGGIYEEKAFGLTETSDGGYILAGYKRVASGDLDVYIIKTDATGTLLWSKVLDGSISEIATSVCENATGGYTITGYTNSFGAGGFDAFLIDIDLLGNVLWSKVYGDSFDQIVNGFQLNPDGSYVLAGIAKTATYDDVFILKTNATGVITWAKKIGEAFTDNAFNVLQTNDNGYILAGATDNFASLNGDLFLIKTDSLGNSGCNTSAFSITDTSVTFTNVSHTSPVSSGGTDAPCGTSSNGSAGIERLVCDGTTIVNTCTGVYSTITSTPPTALGACNGTATALPSSSGPATYNWVGISATGATATNLCEGTYHVIVTEGACQSSAYVRIVDPPYNPCDSLVTTLVVTNATAVDSCNGTALLSFTGGTGSYTYNWTGLSGTSLFQDSICFGAYQVSVTDSVGCQDVLNFNVTYPGTLNAVLLSSGPTSTYTACDGTAQIAVYGGVPPFSYFWIPGGYNTPSVNSLCQANYKVFVTDSTGAKDTVLFSITGPPNPCPGTLTSSLIISDASAAGNCDGSVSAGAITGGIPPFTIYWETGVANCTGHHGMTIIDSLGCMVTLFYDINYPGACNYLFVTDSATNVSAPGMCDGAASAVISGGTPPFTYTWYDPYGVPMTPTTSTVTGLCSGLYPVTVADGAGCLKSVFVPVQCPGFSITAGSTSTSWWMNCNGSAFIDTIIGGVPPFEYLWSPGINLPALINWCPNTYTITVTDSLGCKAMAVTTISDPPPNLCDQFNTPGGASVYNATDQFSCDGTLVGITANGTPPFVFNWLPSNTYGDSLTDVCQGYYSVIITDSRGCTLEPYQVTMGINVYVALVPEEPDTTGGPTRICTGQATSFASFGVAPYTYLWDDGQPTPTAFTLCEGLHFCIASDAATPPSHDTNYVVIARIPYTYITNAAASSSSVAFNDPIEDCSFVYENTEFIYISNYSIIGPTEVMVTWTLMDSLGSSTTIVKPYNCVTSSGIVEFVLSLYCLASNNYANAYDKINFDGSGVGITQMKPTLGTISIYPNPFKDQLTISLEDVKNSKIVITDALGKVVYTDVLSQKKSVIKTDKFLSGIYFVTVYSDKMVRNAKIVKVN